ncbi:unnamed protein product [Notodromas monacha]|uniref:Uncharacterized protein n=1 Tax=Notodromas monacha TaxID=399045 RepID=A0A7R9BMT2_9CRUS|nr:unnamed protein product [Notodromas monacha]CAG0917519.1 unnamed protein product [Notodromas monacha]
MGSVRELTLTMSGIAPVLKNEVEKNVPFVIQAYGSYLWELHQLANFIPGAWDPETKQCVACRMGYFNHAKKDYPLVTLSVLIPRLTPFMDDFFKLLKIWEYPKDKIDLVIYDKVKRIQNRYNYTPFIRVRESLQFHRSVIAPMLPHTHPESIFADYNFRGLKLSDDTYLKGKYDKLIQTNNITGLWIMPLITHSMLVERSVLDAMGDEPFVHRLLEPMQAFSKNLIDLEIPMYITNRVRFGHVITTANYNPDDGATELYQMRENPWDWREHFKHETYDATTAFSNILQPCENVYMAPLVNKRFVMEIIASYDEFTILPLNDGRDNVRILSIAKDGKDILDWEVALYYLVQPIITLNFPDQEAMTSLYTGGHIFLIRHNETTSNWPTFNIPSSMDVTMIISIALNKHGKDFKALGYKFERYGCNVRLEHQGYGLLHPADITHAHSGPRVTEGTYYEMVIGARV